jgi:hypothetical protein
MKLLTLVAQRRISVLDAVGSTDKTTGIHMQLVGSSSGGIFPLNLGEKTP